MNLYLVDGNSYVYRAFYAIRGLSTSGGLPTNAVFGFTNMLLKIIRERKPDHLAIAFDSAAPTERHRLFEDYKAQRPETPAELIEQLPHIRRLIAAFRIAVVELPGYEADDLIGTIAKRAAAEGMEVFIVTADKDMLQLVDDRIRVYDPMKDRILDIDAVMERFGVGPERVSEFMALTGDAVDNIPGVKGIGEKTARELLTSFGSLEELLANPRRIPRERLRKMIEENREMILLSRRLAELDTEAPIEVDLRGYRMDEPDWPSLLALFREFEFSSFMKLLPSSISTGRECETIRTPERLGELLSGVTGQIAFDTEATARSPIAGRLVGVSFCAAKERGHYIPLTHAEGEQVEKPKALEILGSVLGREGIDKIGHNLKYDILLLAGEGVEVRGRLLDTMIASYLINPTRSGHSLDEVALEYLSKRKRSFAEILGKRGNFSEVPIEDAAPYACEDSALSLELAEVLFPILEERGLDTIYFEIEMPLIRVLADMERAGIRIDADLLQGLSRRLAGEIQSIERRIFFLAGEEFNINSPKQLGAILFARLGLSPTKKTKTGYSTGMDVLEELAAHHELPREVLLYRSLTKLKTTYLDVLPTLVNPSSGRVHTSFNQTVTATGRLSSRDPNLQNIPIRGEWGKPIREAFVAEEGNLLLSADYSQVELRILAHLSGDAGLIDAFSKGIDIHSRTAAEIFGLPLDRVTTDMRRTAKTVNFGVIYGISAFGLSETLNVDRKEADRYIRQYFERHPGVKTYIDRVISEAGERGFVSTLFGRTRPVPEFQSRDRATRMFGERLAVNSPIQGTAADIIKVAMIRIWNRLREESLAAKMILQIHDELLFELPEKEIDAVKEMVRAEMEGAVSLSVPIRVDIGFGRNWAEAH